jgi:hypothetical protein
MNHPRTVLRSAAFAAALAITAAGVNAVAAQAAAPSAPPTVEAAPSGTVTEKTRITFRIKASAEDEQFGHWAAVLDSGNLGVVELKPTAAHPSVYERTIRIHNDRVFAAQAEAGDPPDFAAPEATARLFPPRVKWRVAFYPASKPSERGDARTRTPTRTLKFEPTFENREHVNKAGLPSFKTKLIVPNKSFAGISLGNRRRSVLNLFGSPFTSDESLFDRTDEYSRGSVEDQKRHYTGDDLEIEYDQESVALIAINRPSKDPGGLGKLKTKKGIGLGSTRAALLRAYPNIQQNDDDEETGNESFSFVHGLRETYFALDGEHRVAAVGMR